MTQKQAHRRYFKAFVPATAGYLISGIGISWADNHWGLSQTLIFVLTLIPVFCIFIWMWAQWRLVKELDEYLSKLLTEAMMIGFIIITSIAMGWGLMELMTDAPQIPIFFVGPGFFLVYGIAYTVLMKRTGQKRSCK